VRRHKTITVADSKGIIIAKIGGVEGRKDDMNKKFWKEVITSFPSGTY
jgi:hypothetical protein